MGVILHESLVCQGASLWHALGATDAYPLQASWGQRFGCLGASGGSGQTVSIHDYHNHADDAAVLAS